MKQYIRHIALVIVAFLSVEFAWGKTIPTTGGDLTGTYDLTDDVNLTAQCTVSGEVTINLHGKTLSTTSDIRFFLVNSGGTLTINGPGTITGGNLESANNGGAIFVYNGGNLILNGCTIENCTANYGGAIYKQGGDTNNSPSGSVTIKAGTVIRNNKAFVAGGGIYSNTSLSIIGTSENPVVIEKNIAVTEPDGTGSGAKGSGGGIHIPQLTFSGLSCTIKYCKIRDNYAAYTGGGIYSGIPTTIEDSDILRNRAMTTESPLFSKSPNGGRGGGFYFTGRGKDTTTEFVLENTNVKDNACMWYGGGGQIQNYGKLTMNAGTLIDNNICVLKGAAGLHITGTAEVVMNTGSSISYNTSYGGVGGGIHSSYTCEISLQGGEVKGNVVYGRGGGIHVNTGGNLVVQGTNITENKAYTGPNLKYSTVTRNYDGTYSWSTPTPGENNDEEVLETSDTGYGGGILLDCGSCTMKSGTLSKNYAAVGGGGIGLVMINMANKDYFKQVVTSSFTLEDGLVQNNSCGTSNSDKGDGGAIYLMKNKAQQAWNLLSDDDKAALGGVDNEEIQAVLNGIPFINIKGGSVGYNTAIGNGGAAFQEEATQFQIEGETAELSYNSSQKSGGAIYISQGSAIINGGKIQNNTAEEDGGALYVQGDVNVKSDALIKENSSTNGDGGAIYVAGGNNFTIADLATLNVGDNKALNGNGGALYCAGTFIVNGTLNLQNNKAVNGGGVCVNNGSVSLAAGKNSMITNNTATKLGGGLYVVNTTDTQTSAAFNGGTFTNNKAESGGAVCAQGKINLSLAATMEGNEATDGTGGGMYLTGGVNMTFGDGLIRSNQAIGTKVISGGTSEKKDSKTIEPGGVSGVGGGIFMGTGCKLNFNSPELGIYGNSATNAGADICSNGYDTTIGLPNITKMNLKGFDVIGNQLYWVQDYFTGESIPSSTLTGIRYEDALEKEVEISEYIESFGDGDTQKDITSYICLDLGYDLVFVTLTIVDLVGDEIIMMSYPKKQSDGTFDRANPIVYRTVSVDNDTRSVVVVGLPSGEWKFGTKEWNYKCEVDSYTPAHNTNGYINIGKDAYKAVTITFKNKTEGGVQYINENFHRKVNRMKAKTN